MIQEKYRIRPAGVQDKEKIRNLFVQTEANRKNLINSGHVQPAYIEDFVNKVIEQGNMILVENSRNEMELFGEIHCYNTRSAKDENSMKEMIFFSRMENDEIDRETEIVGWLYNEIEKKYKDVFSVEVNTPVKSLHSAEQFLKKGIKIEGNYKARVQNPGHSQNAVLPLSWINPSFN